MLIIVIYIFIQTCLRDTVSSSSLSFSNKFHLFFFLLPPIYFHIFLNHQFLFSSLLCHLFSFDVYPSSFFSFVRPHPFSHPPYHHSFFSYSFPYCPFLQLICTSSFFLLFFPHLLSITFPDLCTMILFLTDNGTRNSLGHLSMTTAVSILAIVVRSRRLLRRRSTQGWEKKEKLLLRRST